ncbi:hypothetical protein FOL47_007090 [Perkinsus chesapeaki]|uniref:Major facilitator superfamily (MFS) profile domain-containing protein n=1 Tax=Perkinsus chesapeaki TaxID=330153 RepID=A0A7J6LMP3_PERCH|nr:hypothetical protein FOL47_007090 [Perkinsus chesapeaki]
MLFGLWSSNASVGNIVGALMAAGALGIAGALSGPKEIGVLMVFIGPSALMLLFAYLSFGLTDYPPTTDNARELEEVPPAPPRTPEMPTFEAMLGGLREIWHAFWLPFVARYSLVYACTKGVNYAMFFWLPFYLSEVCHLDPGHADGLSTFYDMGQCIGGVLAGSIVDKFAKGRKSIVITVFLVLAIIPTLALSMKYESVIPITIIIFVAGLLVGGPANLISAAVCADLGSQAESDVTASVSGLVDGVASIGAALTQLAIPLLTNGTSWLWLFVAFTGMLLLAALLLLPVVKKELTSLSMPREGAPHAHVRE